MSRNRKHSVLQLSKKKAIKSKLLIAVLVASVCRNYQLSLRSDKMTKKGDCLRLLLTQKNLWNRPTRASQIPRIRIRKPRLLRPQPR